MPDGTALVKWTTNEPSSAVVRLGKSADKLQQVGEVDELTKTHELLLTGLDPDTTYYIAGDSTDASGNTGTSKVRSFTTPAAGVTDQQTASFRMGKTAGDATIDDSGLGSVTLSGKTAECTERDVHVRSARRPGDGRLGPGVDPSRASRPGRRSRSASARAACPLLTARGRTGRACRSPAGWMAARAICSTGSRSQLAPGRPRRRLPRLGSATTQDRSNTRRRPVADRRRLGHRATWAGARVVLLDPRFAKSTPPPEARPRFGGRGGSRLRRQSTAYPRPTRSTPGPRSADRACWEGHPMRDSACRRPEPRRSARSPPSPRTWPPRCRPRAAPRPAGPAVSGR